MPRTDIERHARVEAALKRHLGGDWTLEGIEVLTGGASSTTLLVRARTSAGPHPLILRAAQASEGFALEIGKTTEARVQAAAHARGVPAAAVVFTLDPEDGLGEGYAMEWVPGDADPRRFLGDPATRVKLEAQVGEVLARIHAVPLGSLPPLPSASPREQLLGLRDSYDSFEQPSPTFEVAFRWLEERLPSPRPSALVHGDFRTGNLLVDSTGIRAVLDWELCHLGDPIEDLGWCCVAAWRFGRLGDRVGGFGSVERLRQGYAAAGGPAFSDQDLEYWEVFGTLRWGVICLYQVFAHLRGAIPSIERAAVGRRVSEVELDLLRLLR